MTFLFISTLLIEVYGPRRPLDDGANSLIGGIGLLFIFVLGTISLIFSWSIQGFLSSLETLLFLPLFGLVYSVIFFGFLMKVTKVIRKVKDKM